nr:hypothetical protein [Microbispora hainanensis]
MQQSVEQADSGGVLGQEAAPLIERPVRTDAERAAFVGGGHEAKQQLGTGVIQRGEALNRAEFRGGRVSWLG